MSDFAETLKRGDEAWAIVVDEETLSRGVYHLTVDAPARDIDWAGDITRCIGGKVSPLGMPYLFYTHQLYPTREDAERAYALHVLERGS